MTRADPLPLRVRFGEFELDEANALLLRGGRSIDLAPTPFGLLCALARHPGALLTKHVLLDAVWGHRFVSDSVLKTAISDLRSVLGDDPREPRFIETVARRGYRFIAKPAASAAEAASPVNALPIEHSGSLAFVGRAAELARLQRAWDRASTGKRSIVWVAGAPGIGKTTIIERFLSGYRDGAFARGYCVEHFGSGEPYLPVLEALAQLCRIDDSLPRLLRSVAPTWLLQLPWLGTAEDRESLRRELAGVGPERMLREMGELLDRYTEQRPLLLITEDLHWSDRATIQLIDYVARRRSGARLMWLASFRLAEVVASEHPLNSLRHELRVHGLCEEIVLDPFSESEVASFLTGRSSSLGSNESFVRALHTRTDGVPLFLASVIDEVLARVGEKGASADGEDLAQMAVPENVAAIIDRYVQKLSPERRALLAAAAVCGVEFRIETLARALGRDVVEIADACDQLMREQQWLAVSGGRDADEEQAASHRFRHAVFREVLYERLSPSIRSELHRKVGMALEQDRVAGRAVTASELAMHFDRGLSPMPALRYYAEAAEAALRHLSPNECLSLTDRALSLLDRTPPDAERNALEISLATLRGEAAFHLLGVGDEARASFQRASSLLHLVPRHPMRGLLVQGFGLVLCLRAEYAEALATTNRADALATETNDSSLALAARTVQGQVLMMQGRPREARESLERAIPAIGSADGVAERSFGADPQVMLLALLSLQLAHLGLTRQARERLQQAYARARSLGQPVALMIAIWLDTLVEVRIGEVSRVATLADAMRALVEEADLAQGKTAWRSFRGWAEARSGKALEGYRQIRDAYEEDKATGRIAGDSENLGYAAEALLLHGDWQAAQELLQRAYEIVRIYGERIFLPQLLLIEGAIAGARGDHGAAESAIRRAVGEAREQGAAWLELLAMTALCERSTASDEDRHALAALVEQLDEASDTTALLQARALLARA